MKHNLSVIILMILFFIISQIIGLFIIRNYVEFKEGKIEWKELPNLGPLEFDRPKVNENISFIYVFISLLVGTLIFLFLIRYKIKFLWKFWFFVAIFSCLNIGFSAFISEKFAIILAFIVSLLKTFRPALLIHNISELFIYGGMSAIFVPMFNPFSISMLLILISVYDMYAVWKSKHMIELAKFQMESGTFAGILFPYGKKEKCSRKETVKKEIKYTPAKQIQIKIPAKVQTAVLGGGDIGFPLLFTGTMLVYYGWQSLLISLFASLGLLGLFIIGKKGKFYPAMPFISAGCFVGYGLIILMKWFV